MWVRRSDYEALVRELAEQRATREAAEKALALNQQTCEWLRVQVNTLQYERASLLSKVTGAPVMVPTLRSGDESSPIAPPVGQPKPPADQFFNQLSALFEDPGDDAAQKLGIAHDTDGSVLYTQ
jgi:hypothetical protein